MRQSTFSSSFFSSSTISRLPPPPRRFFSSCGIIKERDVLYLRQHGQNAPRWHLTAPLRADGRIKLSYGASLLGSDLIGKKILDVVKDSKGKNVVLHEPSLASYIINSARMATPIYPHDATTIVSLLDLHLPRPGEDEDNDSGPPFEIFEAGTGMGSLTLHLARALHAANPPLKPSLRNAISTASYKREEFGLDLSAEDQADYDAYRASRRAIVHTLDRNYKHSREAHKLIRNWRRALYFPTIDFHVGTIQAYLEARLADRDNEPFLSHAILDLPSAHENAAPVVKALQPNGILILFKPSISQIADFQTWSRETRQPLRLEKVIELPTTSMSEGHRETTHGREWDVKTVTPKEKQAEGIIAPVQVMRPKVGDRVAGGGFVAILRRWPVEEMGEKMAMEEDEGGVKLADEEEDKEAVEEPPMLDITEEETARKLS